MDYIFAGLELCTCTLSTYLFLTMQRNQIKLMDLLAYLERSVVFSPDLLQKVLNKEAPGIYLNSVKNFEEGADYSRGLAMIQGYVESKAPLKSILNGKTNLAVRSIS
jgi:hypothetical protein